MSTVTSLQQLPPPLPTATSKRRPCDRCHRSKEKCQWILGEDASACDRCRHLKAECRTLRPVARMGRKPKLARGNRMALRKTSFADQNSPAKPSYGRHDATSPASSASTSELVVAASPDALAQQLGLYQRVVLLPDLSRLEMHFLDAACHKQLQIDKYIIGPSFRDQHLQSFVDHLDVGLTLVKDAFIACSSVLYGDEQLQQLATGQQIGFKRAAAAVAALRSSTVTVRRDHDLSAILLLGVAMITFACHHPCGEPEPLCRYILGLVKSLCRGGQPLKHQLGDNGIAFLVCLLGTEIESGLLKCQLPTLQIREYEIDQCVDRFIGISLPMFAYFYDVIELAQKLRTARQRGSTDRDMEDLQVAAQELERSIQRWQPSVPVEFLDEHFAPAEVAVMLTQTNILRLAAQLMLHRLEYPYGVYDDKGKLMSNMILDELDNVLQVTGRSVPFSDMPHLAACFEIMDPEDQRKALAKTDDIVDFSPFVLAEHKAWLVSFWSARNNFNDETSVYWHDVDKHIHGEDVFSRQT